MKRLLTKFIAVFLFLFVAINASSQVTFNNTYGQMPFNYGKRILQANDQGYFILGNENGEIANTNIHIIRTDSLGIILYEKTIGDASIYSANDFIRTSDNGFIITGLTNKHPDKGYDVLLVKTDSNANVLWEKTYGGSDWDMGNSVIETKDSAYLITGQTFSYGPGQENIYVIKTNFIGDTLWTRVFGGDSTDYAMSADNRFDSTYLIGATTSSFGQGNLDGYVLNLNRNGDTLWTQTFGEYKEDIINSIKSTPDSGFVFVGSTKSYGANLSTMWLREYDKNMSLIKKMPEIWDIIGIERALYHVNIDDSANIILTGFAYNSGKKDLTFYKFSSSWNFICSFLRASSGDAEGFQSIQTKDKGYATVGTIKGPGPELSDIYVTKILGDCFCSLTDEHILGFEENLKPIKFINAWLSPSVSEGQFNIYFNEKTNNLCQVVVYNLFGQTIFTDHFTPNNESLYHIDISNKAEGFYFVEISNAESRFNFKIMKIIR